MFSDKTFDFLFQNKINNSRDWYIEHKPQYQKYVLEPLIDLATKLGPTISAIDSKIIITPKVDKTISRIYRDTRFSKDKSLYREDFWLSFKRDKKEYEHYPEFFFVATPNNFIYGCGYYAAKNDTMDSIRELILKKDKHFIAANKAYKNQNIFQIDGDMYKRSKYPNEPEELKNWLDRKCISFMVTGTDSEILYSDNLAEKIIPIYEEMSDIYKFFIYAEERARSKRL